jgi:alkanesulfonate monooxygenase SsuD/methylene tetrahydromethanopterin reductase-like flavin-dependent oxidoreductase (luciferase family)
MPAVEPLPPATTLDAQCGGRFELGIQRGHARVAAILEL